MNMKSRIVVVAFLVSAIWPGRPAAQSAAGMQPPPRHFFVRLQMGPAYDASVSIPQQRALPGHSAYMNELERKGLLVLGGPLVASFDSMRPTGAVIILRAETEEQVRAILAADPSQLLSVQEVRPFVFGGGTALKR